MYADARKQHACLHEKAESPLTQYQADSPLTGSTRTTSTVSNLSRDEVDAEITYGSVILITNHSVRPNVTKPWKAHDPVRSTGTGFVLGDKRLITNYHVIEFGASIRVERHGKPGNFEARVLCRSRLSDLALLTVDDDSFWEDLPSVTLQDTVPELDDTVVAVGYPLQARSVTVTRGVVSTVALADLTLTQVNPCQLQVQIDAAINPGNSGGPVFNVETGKVVGAAFSGQQNAQGRGFIIPVPVLKLFLHTYEKNKNPEWGLLPELGCQTESLENPIMRKSCFGGKMPSHRNGCLVTEVDKFSAAAGKLKVGDILLKVDGITVSEKCEVIFRRDEWLHWSYLVTRRPVGEDIDVVVLRKAETGDDMKEVSFNIELAPLPKLLPRIIHVDYFPTYVIAGGVVILPAGYPLQEANLAEFQQRVNPLYQTMVALSREGQMSDLSDQVCVFAGMLAHSCNVTYDRMIGKVVTKVNGTDVKNMKHLASLVSAVKSGELILDFKVSLGDGRCYVVFDAAMLPYAHEEMLRTHKISHWCSPQLLDITS
jgi:S1-C subfamily serine protease